MHIPEVLVILMENCSCFGLDLGPDRRYTGG